MPAADSCRRYAPRPLCAAVSKSIFGIYTLREALRQCPARPVIYISEKTEDAWIFRPNASGDGHDVVPFMKQDLTGLPELKDARTVYISDSLRPLTVDAFTIMITSPRRDRYNEFYKSDGCRLLVIPPFSWAEIQAMHGTCFPHVPTANVIANYALAGGIPRFVFARTYGMVDDEITSAMTKVDLEDMVAEMGSKFIESEAKQSHRLVHMLPRGVVPADDGADIPLPTTLEYYTPARLELASSEVARRVYAAAEVKSTHRLHQLLAEPPSSPVRAALYQSLYESAALAQLARGCTLTCWDATTDKVSTLTVPPSKATYFDNVERMGLLYAADSQQLLVPRSKSFTAIDAVLPGGRLAQVTTSLSHDVKMVGGGNRSKEGLLLAYEALNPTAGSGDDIHLYWILPEARYDELVRSKLPSFRLIIADEVAAAPELAELARLQREANEADAARKKANAARKKADAARKKAAADSGAACTAEQKWRAAVAEAEKAQKQLAPRQAEWAALKQRVRHHAVCLQFTWEGKLKPSQSAPCAGGVAAAPAATSGIPTTGGAPAAVQ